MESASNYVLHDRSVEILTMRGLATRILWTEVAAFIRTVFVLNKFDSVLSKFNQYISKTWRPYWEIRIILPGYKPILCWMKAATDVAYEKRQELIKPKNSDQPTSQQSITLQLERSESSQGRARW